MTYFQAYLLTRLDSFNGLFVGGIMLGVLILTLSTCPLFSEGEKYKKYQTKLVASGFCFLMIFSLLKALIPTTKEAAFIYIAPAIINNQDVQKTIKKLPELSGLGLEYLSEILKEEVRDTKQEINKQIKEQ